MSDPINEQDKAEGTVDVLPASDQPAEVVQEPSLPDGVKERTAEEFEKLKASNAALKLELDAAKGATPRNSVLDELRPNLDLVPQDTIPQPGSQPLVDEGGYVDATLLNSKLTGAETSAAEAKRIAIQTRQEIQNFQESQALQAVYKDFPEIDPNNTESFDPQVFDFVKNDLIGQMMKGKQDVRAAAFKAKQVFSPTVQPRKETISSREQASAPTGTSTGTPDSIDQESLVEGTRKGDKDAIFKRLQASGY